MDYSAMYAVHTRYAYCFWIVEVNIFTLNFDMNLRVEAYESSPSIRIT